MELIYSFTVALFLTIALIPLLIHFSAKLRLVDDPGAERKMHDKVMPRSGGLAIILGAFIPLAFLLPVDGNLRYLFIGSAIIIIFGLLDDRAELNYKWKLFGQSLAVFVVMAGGIVIHKIPFMGLDAAPVWLSYPLTYIFLLGVINGVNFSDGLDGLAAGTSLLALGLIALLAFTIGNTAVALIALTVIGGVLGFLRYNTFPAQIFMGDAGSQFLGFIIACLAIVITQSKASALNPFLPVLILGLPILDIIQVVPVRIKKGLPLPGPDKEHFHHQLVKLGFRHYEVVAVIYLLQIIMMGSAYFLRYESDILILVFYLTYLLVVLGAIYYANVIHWQLRGIQKTFDVKERRNKILRKMNWLHFHSAKMIEITIALFLLIAPFLLSFVSKDFGRTAFILAAMLAFSALLFRHSSALLARLSCYTASVFVVYMLSQDVAGAKYEAFIDGFMIFFGVFLMLAIRTTRREHFRLDTQDLLILLMVIVVPQLPFDSIDSMSVGHIALRLAVLMYGCEYLLARGGKRNYKFLTAASIVSLLAIGAQTL